MSSEQMNTPEPSQKPSVQSNEDRITRGQWWRILGNRGVEYLPAHLFQLTEEELEDISAHQAVPACVWGWTAHNSVYGIERVDGWGVHDGEWEVFTTEEAAQNFLQQP